MTTTKRLPYTLLIDCLLYATILIFFTTLPTQAVSGFVGGAMIGVLGFVLLMILNDYNQQADRTIQELDNRDNQLLQILEAVPKKQHNMAVMANALPSCAAYLDMDYRIMFCNDRFTNLFETKGQNPTNLHLSDVLDTLDYTAFEILLEEIWLNQESLNFERELELANGKLINGTFSITPIVETEHELQSFLLTIENVRTHQQAEMMTKDNVYKQG